MKKCKRCGKELHDSTTRCYNCGKNQKNGLKKFIIFLILFISIIVMALFLGENDKQKDLTEADILESSIDNTNIKKTYSIGEIFKNESVNIKYISSQKDFKRHSQYADVKSQYDITKAEFEFRNLSQIDAFITSNNFSCYADGEKCERFYSVNESYFSTKLLSGKKITHSVYFEVPIK